MMTSVGYKGMISQVHSYNSSSKSDKREARARFSLAIAMIAKKY
jgi:hypothetical protein